MDEEQVKLVSIYQEEHKRETDLINHLILR